MKFHEAQWGPALWAVLLALIYFWVAAGFWGVTYDDGYITYRYADRLASGRGLTWNDDTRVLGTSAPGYALLLAALARAGAGAGLDVADAGSLLTFGSLLLLAALAAALSRESGSPGRGRLWRCATLRADSGTVTE